MEEKPKVLLSCPIYDGKEYVIERYLERIKNLTYSNYDILLVDTSKTNEFAKKIKSQGFNVVKLEYEPNTKVAVCNARNYIRDYVLENNYDYFFSLEQDLIPPIDIIEKLLESNKDVISGWYYITKVPRPCIIKEWTMLNCRFLPKPLTMTDLARNKLMKVFGGSFGVSLIKRKVLEKIKFKVYHLFPHHDDSWFYFDCEKEEFEVWVNTDLLIPHFQDYKWKEIFEKNIKEDLKKMIPKPIESKYMEVEI